MECVAFHVREHTCPSSPQDQVGRESRPKTRISSSLRRWRAYPQLFGEFFAGQRVDSSGVGDRTDREQLAGVCFHGRPVGAGVGCSHRGNHLDAHTIAWETPVVSRIVVAGQGARRGRRRGSWLTERSPGESCFDAVIRRELVPAHAVFWYMLCGSGF
eukprot:1416600-Rhodomonas_salina.1